MAGYCFFLRVYKPKRSLGPSTRKKERGQYPVCSCQYPAILTQKAWSTKDLLFGVALEEFFSRDTAGNPARASSSMPDRVTSHSS